MKLFRPISKRPSVLKLRPFAKIIPHKETLAFLLKILMKENKFENFMCPTFLLVCAQWNFLRPIFDSDILHVCKLESYGETDL